MNRNSPTTVALILASAFGTQGSLANETPSLPTVTVSADQIETAAQKSHNARKQSANPKTVIEAEQLNQFGDQPLGDALRRLVGIAFEGANRAREVRLRGLGVEYTQVTVNGRRILDGNSSRTVQVDRIPSSLVERIEIIHTPMASQDSQGAAGTVNIVLKQGGEHIPSEVSVGLGSLQHNGAVGDATVFHTVGDERVRLSLAGGIQQQRRNESKNAMAFSSSGAANGGSLNLNERRYEQINLTPSVDINIDSANVVHIEPMYLRTTEFRDDMKRTLNAAQSDVTKTEDAYRKRARENGGLYTAWTHKANANTQWVASLDLQKGREDTTRDATTLNASNVATGTRQRTEDVSLERWNLSLAGSTRLQDHNLEYGLAQSSEKRDEDNSDIKDGVIQAPTLNRRFNLNERITSLYLQDAFSPFAGNLLTIGLRGEFADTHTGDFYGQTTSRSSNHWLPSINVRQALSDQTDLRMGMAKTLRRPGLRDLSPTVVQGSGTYASPDTAGNPNALPESIFGLDLGVDHYFQSHKGLLSAKVFARQFKDKLETIYTNESGRIVARTQNAGDGDMSGLELEARLPLEDLGLKQLTLWSNFTAVTTQLTSRQTGEKRRFLDQPDRIANLGLDWFVPQLKTTLGASLNYNSGYRQQYKQADGTTQINEVAAMTRLDLSARAQLTKQTSLNISVLNALGRKEQRVDETRSATGTSSGVTRTTEPTYRSLYVRLSHLF